MERHCKNCNKLLYARQNFCSNCGSKWVDFRITPRSITSEFTQKYLGTDNVFLVTILALFRFPEDVINGFISGMRKKYVNPINFYFISLTLIGLQIYILKTFFPDILGLEEAFEGEELATNILQFFFDYIGLFTTLFIPIYALNSLIVFLDVKKYNFSEHFIFFIYVFGLINIITALFTPIMIWTSMPYQVFTSIVTVLSIIQITWYYKRCFNLSTSQSILKVLIAIPLFVIIQAVYMLLIIFIAIAGIYFIQPEWISNLKINV